MTKITKAFNELPVKIKVDRIYDNTFNVEIENDWDSEYQLTDKQIDTFRQAMFTKLKNMRFKISSAISCPNCKSRIDEGDKVDQYHCSECNLTVTMKFGGKK